MAHQLPPQRRAQQHLGVAAQLRDIGAAAELDDGQRRAGPLHLAGGGGEQRAGGDRLGSQHRGDLVGREVVALGQLQRLPLLGGGPGGLRPGQRGEFTPPLLGLGAAAGGGIRSGPLGEPAQAGPAGEGVEPGAVEVGVRTPAVLPLGEREGLAEDGGRRVVFAQDGQAVREQPVQIRLVAAVAALLTAGAVLAVGAALAAAAVLAVRTLRRAGVLAPVGGVLCGVGPAGPLGGLRPAAARGAGARSVCAGGVRGVLGPAAHHPATVGG